jgi:hypothetical protein
MLHHCCTIFEENPAALQCVLFTDEAHFHVNGYVSQDQCAALATEDSGDKAVLPETAVLYYWNSFPQRFYQCGMFMSPRPPRNGCQFLQNSLS